LGHFQALQNRLALKFVQEDSGGKRLATAHYILTVNSLFQEMAPLPRWVTGLLKTRRKGKVRRMCLYQHC
jgi:hypothetical protein